MPDTNEKVAALDALAAHTHEAASIWHEAWRTWLRAAALSAPQGDPIPKGEQESGALAYLITFREVRTNSVKCITTASLEPRAPTIFLPEDAGVESRELLKCIPLGVNQMTDLISREQAVKVDELLDRARQYLHGADIYVDARQFAGDDLIRELLSLCESLPLAPLAAEWVQVPRDLLEELDDYLLDREDVRDGSDGRPLPNDAMSLRTRLECYILQPTAPSAPRGRDEI